MVLVILENLEVENLEGSAKPVYMEDTSVWNAYMVGPWAYTNKCIRAEQKAVLPFTVCVGQL